jgi:2'-5' RNA ligase
MQLGIAILVPDEVHNAMRRWQLMAATVCGANAALKVHPHITLKQPFHAKTLAPIEHYFDALVANLEPVEIHLDGMGSFVNEGVVFLDVSAGADLEPLRLRVLRDLREQYSVKPRDIEDDRYKFHATVAYGLPAGTFDRAWEALRDIEARFSFWLESLGLFYYTGEAWVLYKKSSVRHQARGSA